MGFKKVDLRGIESRISEERHESYPMRECLHKLDWATGPPGLANPATPHIIRFTSHGPQSHSKFQLGGSIWFVKCQGYHRIRTALVRWIRATTQGHQEVRGKENQIQSKVNSVEVGHVWGLSSTGSVRSCKTKNIVMIHENALNYHLYSS